MQSGRTILHRETKNMKGRFYVTALVVLALAQIVTAEYNASLVFSILRKSGLCVPQTECDSGEINNSYKDIPADCSGILVCGGDGTQNFQLKEAGNLASWADSAMTGCSIASFARGEAIIVSDPDQFYSAIGNHSYGAIILVEHMNFKSPHTNEELLDNISLRGYPMINRALAILGACERPQAEDENNYSLDLRHGMCIIDGKKFSPLFDVSGKITASITLYNLRLQRGFIPTLSYKDQKPNLSYGGTALEMLDGGAAYLIQVDIVDNKGVWGGAIKLEASNWHSKFICVRCRFLDNYSDIIGGACVYIEGPVIAAFIDTTFENCITGNESSISGQYGAWGGAVTLFSNQFTPTEASTVFFMGCSFSSNTQKGGKIPFSTINTMHGENEKNVDVFILCDYCTTVFDMQPLCAGSNEYDPAESYSNSNEFSRNYAILGGACENLAGLDKSMYPSPQILYIPSMPSYGSTNISAEKMNKCQDGMDDMILACMVDTHEGPCLIETTGGELPNISKLSKYFLINEIIPGDVDTINVTGTNCSELSQEDAMTSPSDCLYKITMDASHYKSFSTNLPRDLDLQFIKNDTTSDEEPRPKKDHTGMEAKYIILVVVTSTAVLALGIWIVYFQKQRSKHGRRYHEFTRIPLLNWFGDDIESTSSIHIMGGKENKKKYCRVDGKISPGLKPSDGLANWAHDLGSALEEILIPHADVKIEKSLARGAQAEVYKGHWGTASVAMKKQLMQHMKDGKTMVNKIMEGEVAMMMKLRHPHVVQLFGLTPAPPYVYIVMEFMSKGSLKQLLDNRSETLSPNRRLNIAYQISEGMQFLHKEKIIHRDLKPGNVFISDNFTAKVGDFGLSRHVQMPDCNANSFVGTPGYMAPEVSEGSPYTFPADVWSFGSLFHELITGRHYYAEYSMSGQIFTAILQRKELPEIKNIIPGWSVAVLKLVEESCSRVPISRPSFATVRDILKSEVEKGTVAHETM